MDSFDIKYTDGSVDKVKRLKRVQYKDLKVLQQEILYFFFKNQASVGACLAEEEVWSAITKISKLLPVIGNEKTGIKLTDIEDDLEQLTEIFFTTSKKKDNGEFESPNELIEKGVWYEPS